MNIKTKCPQCGKECYATTDWWGNTRYFYKRPKTKNDPNNSDMGFTHSWIWDIHQCKKEQKK